MDKEEKLSSVDYEEACLTELYESSAFDSAKPRPTAIASAGTASKMHSKKMTPVKVNKIRKKLFKIEILPIVGLIIAGIINSLGVALLLVPTHMIDGGLSGLSILLAKFLPLPISAFLLILNIPFYLFALKKMGVKFILYSLIAIISYSVSVYILQNVLKLCGENIDTSPITNVPILAAIFGGLLSGIGSGLTIRCGGSLDGVEVMAVFLTKRVNISVGKLVMSFNAVMYTVAGFLLHDFNYPLYSIIAYAVGLKAVDGIVEGLDKAKAIMVITAEGEAVARALNDIMGSGVTMIKGTGYYSKAEKTVLYYVANRFEIGKVKRIIAEVDRAAFFSITDVSEVIGKPKGNIFGFRKRKKTRKG